MFELIRLLIGAFAVLVIACVSWAVGGWLGDQTWRRRP